MLKRARKLEPTDSFANMLLGIDLLTTGKESDAVPRLQLAARRKPGEEIPEDCLGEAGALRTSGLGLHAGPSREDTLQQSRSRHGVNLRWSDSARSARAFVPLLPAWR